MKNIFFALKISFYSSPLRAVMDFVVKLLFRTYAIFYNVFFLGYVLKVIERNENVYWVWILVGISIIYMVAYDFLAAWYYNSYKPYADQDVLKKYKELVFHKTADVDLDCYENAEFYNNYTKATTEISKRFDGILSIISEMIVDVFALGSLFFTVIKLDTFASVICLVPLLTKNFIGKRFNSIKYKLFTESVEPNRKKEYIRRTVYLKDYCKEIHTSNIFSLLCEKFDMASKEILENIKKNGWRIAIYDFLNSTSVDTFTYFIILLYASYRALVTHTLSVGDYIILINAISKLSSTLVDFTNRIVNLQEYSKYVGSIKSFLHMPSRILDGTKSIQSNEIRKVEFKNVSFKYSGQKEYCLKKVNISINAGEKIAIIGINGAGKTTLVKLLMRLYDVSEGEVLVNGINIKEYKVKEYRNIFSTVFQDYNIYAATIAENVVLDIKTDNKDEINSALINSGAYSYLVDVCKKEMQERVLTKEFDNEGLVLSGGQFQKIAIARAFIKSRGIAILDEPSSALDPLAEREMFQKLLEVCKDKITMFISHRLSAAALADRIYVIDNGAVAEYGTHEQLMRAEGIYYNMYIKQNKRFANGGRMNNEE